MFNFSDDKPLSKQCYEWAMFYLTIATLHPKGSAIREHYYKRVNAYKRVSRMLKRKGY